MLGRLVVGIACCSEYLSAIAEVFGTLQADHNHRSAAWHLAAAVPSVSVIGANGTYIVGSHCQVESLCISLVLFLLPGPKAMQYVPQMVQSRRSASWMICSSNGYKVLTDKKGWQPIECSGSMFTSMRRADISHQITRH